jgi:hypothetical protein
MTGNFCQWELGNSDTGRFNGRTGASRPIRFWRSARIHRGVRRTALAVPGYLLIGGGRQDACERVPDTAGIQWYGQTAAAQALLALREAEGQG